MHLADEMQRNATEDGHLDRAMYSCTSSFRFTQKMKTSCGGCGGGWRREGRRE